ncbi:MAG: DUF6807 family protein [Tepidisphaeraceae bacterium]
MTKVLSFTFIAFVACSLAFAEKLLLTTIKENAAVSVKQGDKLVAAYQLQPEKNINLSVESGCYFHPLMTPAGVAVTEVGPADHPHHRGVFLGWVEMHGKKDADFWGWGEHAPKKDRRIVSREVSDLRTGDAGGFVARNEWLAENEVIIAERLTAQVRAVDGANVLDLEYTLTPTADTKLPRWAFSGFCVRTRLDGKLEAHSPEGVVNLPNPSHVKPESDWPAAAWYAYQLSGVADGKTVGVAVVDHPKNPPSLWHNHRAIGMINPCIVAPSEVTLKADQPLVLRYRVLAFDGELPRELVTRLAKEFRGS